MERRVLGAKLNRLACGQVVVCKYVRQKLQQELAFRIPCAQLICFTESVAYDETPLKTSCKAAPESSGNLVVGSECDDHTGADVEKVLRKLALSMKEGSVTAKVLQTRSHSGIVIAVNGSIVTLVYDTISPLQTMSRGSSAVLLQALSRNGSTSEPMTNGYDFRSRLVSLDRAAYNTKAEAAHAINRGPGWVTALFYCDAHGCSNAVGKTVDALQTSKVSGIIAMALILRQGSALKFFKQCMQDVILEKLLLLRGHAPVSAVKYKEKVMQIFMSGPSSTFLDKLLMWKLPNGNWQRRDCIEYYLPGHVERIPSKSELAAMLVGGLMYVFLRRKPTIFTKNRWTGLDTSLDQLGRLEACHGLLTRTFFKFVQKQSGKSLSMSAPESLPLVDVDSHVDLEMDVLGLASPLDEHLLGMSGSGSASQKGPVEDPHVAEAQRSADAHAQDIQKVLQWLSGDAFTDLVVLRLAIEPLMNMMLNILNISGQDWEVEQEATFLLKKRSGAALTGPGRHFQLTVAADLQLEKNFYDLLASMFEASLWEVIPEKRHTVAQNALVFRLLSRAGCLVEENIRQPHRCFPCAMFQLLSRTATPEQILSLPRCLMDKWSSELLERMPTLQGQEFHATLELQARLGTSTIAGIESRHSSIRRHLVGKSLQTHVFPVDELSAQFVMQQLRASHQLLQERGCKSSGTSLAEQQTQASHFIKPP
eukprot:2670820-Amphidinium_carterae.2